MCVLLLARTRVSGGAGRASAGDSEGTIVMVRFVTNIVLTGLAIALLGILVLLSTNADEGLRRQADSNLRQLREVAAEIERDALDSRNLQIDSDKQLQALGADVHSRVEAIGRDLRVLFPLDPPWRARFRTMAESAFNSIDRRVSERADSEILQRKFAELNQSAARLGDRVAGFRDNQTRYLDVRQTLTNDSRTFVKRLREHGASSLADSIFRAAQQVLERAERGTDADLEQIEAITNRLAADTQFKVAGDRDTFLGLIETMRALTPVRRAVETNLTDIVGGRFQRQVMNLNELITRDTLYRLTTVNDSRVLLNVYTVLLLLMLGYFGIRLQRSYRALNRSHEELALANTSLEARVHERTRDLERAYEDLKESQVQLVQAEKMSSLGQLVAGIVHEINTPLLYVVNNASVTAENVEDLRECVTAAARLAALVGARGAQSGEVQAALQRLADRTDPKALAETIDEIVTLTHDSTEGLHQISELVQSLKDFSRLDRAAEDRFDVREGLEKTLLITRNLLKYGVTIERRFNEVPAILCAPSKINQVFINLVTNAVQAMDGKGTLTITTKAREAYVDIEVCDTGCGIAPEHLNKVMDPFFTTKPVGQGTGLGLSIVRKIVDEHGGKISVDSKVGVGTTITISLPIDRGVSGAAEDAVELDSDAEAA
jgi:signal transduction histidine kinase